MRRMMTRHELEVLQGFPAGRIRLPAGVSEKVYAGMLGNAFTVPIVGRVCLALLRTVGIVDPTWPDVWARWYGSPAAGAPALSGGLLPPAILGLVAEPHSVGGEGCGGRRCPHT